MYDGVVTNVKTVGGVSPEFSISIGLHQGSALSPYLFTLIMDEITKDIQGRVPWCMLFADDIVLVSESKYDINVKMELWRETLNPKV